MIGPPVKVYELDELLIVIANGVTAHVPPLIVTTELLAVGSPNVTVSPST